jgi:hypothetical protein
MSNPAGNYPGRQIFLGSINGLPAFAYLVTGRSEQSKNRYASIEDGNSIRIKPLDEHESFDNFRHYQAVKINPDTGLLVVSNSQAPVDAVFEAYTFRTDEEKKEHFLERLLGAIGPEYDTNVLHKRTPRIVGVSFSSANDWTNTLGISTSKRHGFDIIFNTQEKNELRWVSTYNGDIDYRSFDPMLLVDSKNIFVPESNNSGDLANEIYSMTDYIDGKYGDLRACVIAGMHNNSGPGGWNIFIKNRVDK